jgi:hypothetical protein
VGWYPVIWLTSGKHNVTDMDSMQFFNFTKLEKKVMKNGKVCINGETLNWQRIVLLQYVKNEPMVTAGR